MAIFGAGPGLGQAVASRYAREGYTIVLVARRKAPLERCAEQLTKKGATVHVLTADLSDTAVAGTLAKQIRKLVGSLGTLYYAPTPKSGFVAAAELTPERAQESMPLTFYTLVALVQEFLPDMLKRGEGAILTAQGASSVKGIPYLSGPSPAQAAQRNYLQSLQAEIASKGVYVGRLYIGAAIKHTPFYEQMQADKAAGRPVWEMPIIDPIELAEMIWQMHRAQSESELFYPARKS